MKRVEILKRLTQGSKVYVPIRVDLPHGYEIIYVKADSIDLAHAMADIPADVDYRMNITNPDNVSNTRCWTIWAESA